MFLTDKDDLKCIAKHPIFFALEDGNLYIYIQDKLIGMVSEFNLSCKQGITELHIKRIDYVEGTWNKEWEHILRKHVNIFHFESIDMTHLGPHFTLDLIFK